MFCVLVKVYVPVKYFPVQQVLKFLGIFLSVSLNLHWYTWNFYYFLHYNFYIVSSNLMENILYFALRPSWRTHFQKSSSTRKYTNI